MAGGWSQVANYTRGGQVKETIPVLPGFICFGIDLEMLWCMDTGMSGQIIKSPFCELYFWYVYNNATFEVFKSGVVDKLTDAGVEIAAAFDIFLEGK